MIQVGQKYSLDFIRNAGKGYQIIKTNKYSDKILKILVQGTKKEVFIWLDGFLSSFEEKMEFTEKDKEELIKLSEEIADKLKI